MEATALSVGKSVLDVDGALGYAKSAAAEEGEGLRVIAVWGTGGDLAQASIISEAYENPDIKNKFPWQASVKLPALPSVTTYRFPSFLSRAILSPSISRAPPLPCPLRASRRPLPLGPPPDADPASARRPPDRPRRAPRRAPAAARRPPGRPPTRPPPPPAARGLDDLDRSLALSPFLSLPSLRAAAARRFPQSTPSAPARVDASAPACSPSIRGAVGLPSGHGRWPLAQNLPHSVFPGACGFLRPSRRTRAPSPPARLRFAAAVGIPRGSRMPPASPAGTGAGPSRETSPTPSIRSRELARRVEFCDARLEVTTATSDVRKGQWH
ncbi:vegetative cell wall protein gp1-like [Panicum hallii]|uniref:vegetative cell wall protein gp1-like n=1 Tax=Panicum hallii TaxID=206008 RepID=UPI000DF4D7C7|nr:vegetative cell wall protein gp1-like [Panicum hallii]